MSTLTSPVETVQHTDPSPYTKAHNTLRYHYAKDDHGRDNYSEDYPSAEAAKAAFDGAIEAESIGDRAIRTVAIVAGGRRHKVQGGEKEILEGGKQLAAWSKEGGLHAPEGWESGLKNAVEADQATEAPAPKTKKSKGE